jgi:Zn-dependent protease with chaperone function
VQAVCFDGRSATARPVTIEFVGGRMFVEGPGLCFDTPLEAVEITDRLGHTPRQLRFPDGGFCEVADSDDFERLLTGEGAQSSAVDRWERSGRAAAIAVVALVSAGFLAYRFGVPMLADSVARNLPGTVVNSLSDNAARMLDQLVFAPTKIPQDRQSDLRFAFGRLRLPGHHGPRTEQIEFRRSDALGPNALALPSGRIIVTDALMALAKDDRELLGVLAHEAGHVQARHGLRELLQSSIVALVLTWYVGDVSTIAATAPTALLDAKYSRDFEREADAYAAAALALNGIPLSHLADILERMEQHHRGTGSPSYLSSHPATAERLERLRGRSFFPQK